MVNLPRPARPEGSLLEVGGVRIGDGEFVVIAGPCSVESREQIVETARAVQARGAVMLRGGAFKPRTSPYAFQGLGWEGEGFTEEELAAVRGWLSGKATTIYGGSFEIQNNIISKRILGLPDSTRSA